LQQSSTCIKEFSSSKCESSLDTANAKLKILYSVFDFVNAESEVNVIGTSE